MSTALFRVCDQHDHLAGGDDRHFLAALLSPAVGSERADEIAAVLLDQVDLLHIAKEDAAYFEQLGIDPSAIATLTAAFKLSARLAEARITDRPVFENPEGIAQFLVQRYRLRDQEVFGALFLDTGGRLIAGEELFRGSGSACVVDPRFIMRRALLWSAASLAVFHSHPAGTTTPSLHDIEFTKRMAKACECMNVRLLDHLIVAPDGRFTSLRRRRCW